MLAGGDRVAAGGVVAVTARTGHRLEAGTMRVAPRAVAVRVGHARLARGVITVIGCLNVARLADAIRGGPSSGVITEAGEVLEVDRLGDVRPDRGRNALNNTFDVVRVHGVAGFAGECTVLATGDPPVPAPFRIGAIGEVDAVMKESRARINGRRGSCDRAPGNAVGVAEGCLEVIGRIGGKAANRGGEGTGATGCCRSGVRITPGRSPPHDNAAVVSVLVTGERGCDRDGRVGHVAERQSSGCCVIDRQGRPGTALRTAGQSVGIGEGRLEVVGRIGGEAAHRGGIGPAAAGCAGGIRIAAGTGPPADGAAVVAVIVAGEGGRDGDAGGGHAAVAQGGGGRAVDRGGIGDGNGSDVDAERSAGGGVVVTYHDAKGRGIHVSV